MSRAAPRLLALPAIALTACAPQGEAPGEDRSLAPAADLDTVVYNLGSPPRSVDPALTVTIVGFNVGEHVFEGLTAVGTGEAVEPGVAERWEVSDDGLLYDFHLREDARWSDGRPVVAGDFAYAWTRALTPETGAAYANLLYAIENAEAFHRGEISDPTQLGIEVISDRHLRVRLSRPVSYFLQLTSFITMMPLRRDVVEADPEGWSHRAETFLGNGAFVLTEYEPNHQFVFERNSLYWNADAVTLERLVWLQIDDPRSEYTAYVTGQLDATSGVPYPDMPEIRERFSDHLRVEPMAGTYYIYFNFDRPSLDDVRVRRALMLAVDREGITRDVTEGLNRPASGWVPAGIPDADGATDFCDVSGEMVPLQPVEEARRLLAEAGYPGGEGFPELGYLYNTHDVNRQVAERLQALWERELGIRVRLQNQEWQVLVANLQEGNFELGRFSWIGDYADPMTFLHIWMSDDGNNRGRYRSAEYDALITEAMNTADRERYFALCHRAEQMLIDDAALVPIWFTRNPVLVNPALEGLVLTPTGDVLFHRAHWNRDRLRESGVEVGA